MYKCAIFDKITKYFIPGVHLQSSKILVGTWPSWPPFRTVPVYSKFKKIRCEYIISFTMRTTIVHLWPRVGAMAAKNLGFEKFFLCF